MSCKKQTFDFFKRNQPLSRKRQILSPQTARVDLKNRHTLVCEFLNESSGKLVRWPANISSYRSVPGEQIIVLNPVWASNIIIIMSPPILRRQPWYSSLEWLDVYAGIFTACNDPARRQAALARVRQTDRQTQTDKYYTGIHRPSFFRFYWLRQLLS